MIKKQTIIVGLLLLSLIGFGQTKTDINSNFFTTKYSGVYSYGANVGKGRIGTISIYPETDSTILFYIDLNGGEPSYNMGSLYGRVKISNDTGIFYSKYDFSDTGCKRRFNFTKNSLKIETLDDQYDCGFGNGVIGDGEYKRKTYTTKDFFEDMSGNKIYFKTTNPEDYYKD